MSDAWIDAGKLRSVRLDACGPGCLILWRETNSKLLGVGVTFAWPARDGSTRGAFLLPVRSDHVFRPGEVIEASKLSYTAMQLNEPFRVEVDLSGPVEGTQGFQPGPQGWFCLDEKHAGLSIQDVDGDRAARSLDVGEWAAVDREPGYDFTWCWRIVVGDEAGGAKAVIEPRFAK